jgi:hypothetical protein
MRTARDRLNLFLGLYDRAASEFNFETMLPTERRELEAALSRLRENLDILVKRLEELAALKGVNDSEEDISALVDVLNSAYRAGAETILTHRQQRLAKSWDRSDLGKKTAAGNQRLMTAWHDYTRKRLADMEAVNPRLSAEDLATNMLSSWKCKERKPSQRTLADFIRDERKLKKAALAAEHSVYD